MRVRRWGLSIVATENNRQHNQEQDELFIPRIGARSPGRLVGRRNFFGARRRKENPWPEEKNPGCQSAAPVRAAP